MACLGGLACWPCSADNWLYRHTQQLAVYIVQPSAEVTRVSVGQQRDACALTKRTVVQGECRKPQCTCPFPAAHKPTNQTRGVDIPKHQSVSASCQTTIKHMGGSLLASHGIISYVRWTFASKCSLPCVPNLLKQVLMLIHPLPCQGIKLIEPMEI